MIETAQNWSMAAGAAFERPIGKNDRYWPQPLAVHASGRGVAERVLSPEAFDGATTGLELCLERETYSGFAPAMDMSDVRLEKIVRLRVAIASGCYRVRAADLADKLIASVTGRTMEDRRRYD